MKNRTPFVLRAPHTMRSMLVAALSLLAAGSASAIDKVSFATNWKAEAEHGGFYQAVADGTYAKYGLEVTIRPGGPQSNERALLTAGKVEFLMAGATAVQVGTATFRDPLAPLKVLDGIERFMRDEGVADVRDLIGAAKA